MPRLTVTTPILHNGKPYEIGDTIEDGVLTDAQADALVAARAAERVNSPSEPDEPAFAGDDAGIEAAIGARATDALVAAGLTDAAEILALSDDELAAIKGIGPKTVQAIAALRPEGDANTPEGDSNTDA